MPLEGHLIPVLPKVLSELISIGGFLYGFGKDLIKASKFTKKEKLVDSECLEKSGLQKKYQKAGFHLCWVVPHRVETKKLDGYEVLYEVDKLKQIKSSLARRDGSVLMSKSR